MNPSFRTGLQEAIAHALRTSGSYTGEIDPPTAQRCVDAQWAAHLAARVVGVRVTVSVVIRRGEGPDRTILCVTSCS